MSKVLNDWSASQRASIIGEAVLFSFKIMFDLGDADLVFDLGDADLGDADLVWSRSVGGLPQDSFQHYQFSL